MNLTSKTYLTRSLLNRILGKELSNNDIDDLIMEDRLIKKFSYYQATDRLLRELKIISPVVRIPEENFGTIAKKHNFTLSEIQELFGDLNYDMTKLLAKKYFYKRYNYFYKSDLLSEMLADGQEEYEI